VHEDIEAIQLDLKSGDADQDQAVARALQVLQDLVGVIQPLAKAYKRVHG
jgi:16S rRNA G527 N7-methylase RsmG